MVLLKSTYVSSNYSVCVQNIQSLKIEYLSLVTDLSVEIITILSFPRCSLESVVYTGMNLARYFFIEVILLRSWMLE